MLLKSKDGIICDVCGQAYKNTFTYCSFESNHITVDNARRSVNQQGKDLDIDVCEKCYLTAEEKVRKNLTDKPEPNTIKCDFCKTVLRNNFTYHRILIHKVIVDNNRKKEEGNAIVQKNFMDFNCDDKCFTDLANLVMTTREKVKLEGVWS